jgi:DNA polymerase III delta prime subunit
LDKSRLARWLTAKDRSKIAAYPDHYCAPYAEKIEHLSRIAGISSGARKILTSNGMTSTTAVAGSTGDETAYKSHSLLKKERRNFPGRAAALHTGKVDRDSSVLIATLAKNPYLQINASVNYDSSSGRISFPYRLTPPIPAQVSLKATPFIVDSISLKDEWVALEGFLDHLASFIERAETEFGKEGYDNHKITAQVAFWDEQQYLELCAAMGRHLPMILSLAKRKAKALAWLFPADELLERENGAVSPCVVFVNQIIRRAVYIPKAHSLTLFDVAEHYYYGTYKPFIPDALYRDYLSDGIPRERIYEIWSHAASVIRAGRSIPRTTLINELGKALEAQCKALDSIILRLRTDFKPQLKGIADIVETTIPTGARNVSFDGKLWIWWDQLDKATSNIEAHRVLAEDAERLEASYETIRLIKRKDMLPSGSWVYEVNPDSSEAKLDDNDSYLALGSENIPGLPLTKVKDHIATTLVLLYTGNPNTLNLPFWTAVRVKLISFDRDNLEAVIELSSKDPELIPFLEVHSTIDFTSNLFITNSKNSYDQSEITRDILRAISNPPIAVPDPNALAAMAIKAGKVGRSPVFPIAQVLWDPSSLQGKSKITSAEASAIAFDARTLQRLNDSQTKAVHHACERLLTIIWGPPGTGKTKTLVALIQTIVRNAKKYGKGINVLISGPTYKSIEEVIDRLIESLERDTSNVCEIFVGYGKSRVAKNFNTAATHLSLVPFYFRTGDSHWNDCSTSLKDNQKITIVAASCHQAHKITEYKANKKIDSIFDMVILDESSQIPVSRALGPLTGLKEEGQIVVAGDHFQMPPIQKLDPPVGAEYLVGSIQTYLLKRPFGKPITTCNLLENYRSSKDIVDYAKTIGYPVDLVSVYPDTKIKLLKSVSSLKKGFPAHLPWSDEWSNLIDPEKSALTLLHQDDNSSQSSEFEARLVAAIAYILRNTVSNQLDGRSITPTHSHPTSEDFWKKVIGIVTPHKAQRALVIRELKKLFPMDSVEQISGAVDTVEKFQGGERHVIIVSYAVGDPEVISGEEAFLMQLERTNVAVSRAMSKCIIIMPETLAGHIPQQKKAIETAHALKGFVDEFCNKTGIMEFPSDAKKGQLKWHE